MQEKSVVSATRYTPPAVPFDPPGDVPTTERLEAYMDHGRPMLNNYTRYAKVGGGQHGEVYLCYKLNPRLPQGHPERRIPVAMKSVRRDNPRAEQLKKLRQQRLPTSEHTPIADKLNTTEAKIRKEIAIMKKLRHPHVVRLFEVIDDRMKDKIYMVMEYLGGGEVKWRNEADQPILTLEQSRRIFRDAILGLEYLHHQGIIHRDIKPANLLWTEDRRQVKIGDFGVSHFSYAQRLAAAGPDDTEDPTDPILLDDSDLSKRAGTPSFLAPEVVFEHTMESPASQPDLVTHGSLSTAHLASSQSLPISSNPNRPPITKAIDIWALGITLYCLLFGRTPFVADPAVHGSEWSLYNAICNQDWAVDDTMAFDQVPTGGRHPVREDADGAIVIHLLDHLLEKDMKLRITLEEVKHSPWFLRDLPDPQNWLKVTSPAKIDVSVDEASDAMSTVHFRWNWGAQITRRISSLLRTVRQQRSRDRIAATQEGRGAVTSEPHLRIRTQTAALLLEPQTASQPNPGFGGRDKGKHKAGGATTAVGAQEARVVVGQKRGQSSSKSLRSKSIDRWPAAAYRGANSASTSKLATTRGGASNSVASQGNHGVKTKTRRGSETVVVDRSGGTSFEQQQPSPTTSSDKPRARFALFFSGISHWRPNKYSPQGPASPVDTAATSSSNVTLQTQSLAPTTTATKMTHRSAIRRSEEALRGYRSQLDNQSTSTGGASGQFTAARRASSWGQGDQPLEFTDVASLPSAGDLTEHIMNVGAGGVSNDRSFVPRTSSKLTASPITPLSPGAGTGESAFGDEDGEYGPPCFDEDSSTIASALGSVEERKWQNGSDYEEGEEEGSQEGGTSDEHDGGVVFTPRKHANADE